MKKRVFSFLTALALCLTLVPAAVFAETAEAEAVPVCVCETRCAEEHMNEECPVCGAEDALPEDCTAPEGEAVPLSDAAVESDRDTEKSEGGADGPEGEAGDAENETENSADDADDGISLMSSADNGVSVQATGGELWLGGVNVLERPSGNGPNGGSYSFESPTLTLTDYKAYGESYHSFERGSSKVKTSAYLYTTMQALKIELVGDCQFGSENYADQYLNDPGTVRTVGIASDPNTNQYIYINSNGGKGNLKVYTHVWPLAVRNVNIYAGTFDLKSAMDGCSLRGSMTVNNNSNVTMSSMTGKLAFSGASITGRLKVSNNASVTVTSNGTTYEDKNPKALDAGSITVSGNGQLIATSSGRNTNDGCQGYGIYVGNLSIYDNGHVEAYSKGYNTSKNAYDGKEAIYVTGKLEMSSGAYLYAKTENQTTDNGDLSANGALRFSSKATWKLAINNDAGKLNNNLAVVTWPIGGQLRENERCVRGGTAYSAKEVKIQGIRNTVLTFNLNNGYQTYYYRDKDNTSTGEYDQYSRYTPNDVDGELDLQQGYGSSLGPADHQAFYGIDIREGVHTIVLDTIVQERDHPYITVRNGATLNLELKDKSYLEYTNGYIFDHVIKVESGGTLNITGDAENYLSTALTLIGGIAAESGAKVSFKNCIVYTSGYIGGDGANISVENCWMNAVGFVGNLTVQNSTVKGNYEDGGTLTIDRKSNAILQVNPDAEVKDTDGTRVYRTEIELESFSQSTNWRPILYRQTKSSEANLVSCAVVTGLRLKYGTSDAIKLEGLSMLADGDKIVLWLPFNTITENVYGFDDGSDQIVGFVHDQGEYSKIVTGANHNNSGKLALRNLLLAAGILALRGTEELCAGYEESSKDTWIGYHKEKEVKLQSTKTVTGFGIRALETADAEVKLNGLKLVGDRKRVEVDNGAKLSMVLMKDTENSMTTSKNGEDAVWTLKGSGSLTIRSQGGSEKLTLVGHHAIDGSENASLTIENSTIINNCTNQPETKLGRLVIKNSTVTGLGTINCSDITIDGGSVDLDVPAGKSVKDSKDNALTKTTLIFNEKNTGVDDITVSGLPEGTTFDKSNIITDRDGKLYIWLPEGAKVKTVTIGENTYYPKADGSTTTGEVPAFTSPRKDSSKVVVNGGKLGLAVTAADRAPDPALQWQVSTDGGGTWENIEGATEEAYNGTMQLAWHGAKFRCVAKNTAGEATSATFTVYYCPDAVSAVKSPLKNSFKKGENVSFTATLSGYPDYRPFSELTGVDVQYQWLMRYGPQTPDSDDECWNDISPTENATYTVEVTEEMDFWSVFCKLTLTYPDNQTVVIAKRLAYNLQVVVCPEIAVSPQDTEVEAGNTATFSVTAALPDGKRAYTIRYQWQVSKDGIDWENIDGASGNMAEEWKNSSYSYAASYIIPAAAAEHDGCWYRCEVKNTNGKAGADLVSSDSVYSEPAKLTVTGLPVITEQPQDAAVTYGADASFRVEAKADGGGTLRYQWQVKAADGEFTDIDGATESSYTVTEPAVSMSGNQYRCVVTNERNSASVTSAAVTLTVNRKSIAIPAEDAKTYTYNGQAQTYGVAATADYTVTGGTQTEANESGYPVTVSLTDKDNTQWSDGTTADRSYTFVIFRARVTVTALDKRIYIGGKVPDLTNPEQGKDYTVSGLFGEDALSGTLVLSYLDADGNPVEPETKKAGGYIIRASGAEAPANYEVVFVDGRLTVRVRPSGGNTPVYPVTTPDKTENGSVSTDPKSAGTGETVTITIKPDTGYELGDLIITDKNGNRVEAVDRGNGKFTFVMPDGGVTIRASFVKESETSPFRDVPVTAYYYKAVSWAAKNGITGGIGNGLFGPELGCTRAQFVTFLWRAAGSPAPKALSSFTDVPADAYYAKAVAWAVENGITDGTSPTTFSPNATCTRAHAVTFLWRAFGKPSGSGASFTDVPSGAYYAEAVAWAAENDVTTGVGDGRFAPDDTCTRAQIVTFLWRAYRGE